MEAACARSGRHVEEVKLLLATKTVTLEKLQMAMQAGEVLFGKIKPRSFGTNSRLCSNTTG